MHKHQRTNLTGIKVKSPCTHTRYEPPECHTTCKRRWKIWCCHSHIVRWTATGRGWSRSDTLFRLCDRLFKWVLGIYVPQDFQDPTSQDEAITRRKTRREELLRRIITEEDGTFVKTTNWEIHPLEVVLKSEAILEILKKMTPEATSPPQHPRLSESPEQAHLENDDEIEEVQEAWHTEDSTKDNQREGTRDMLRLLSHDRTEFQVPKEVGTLLAELIARVRSMEERLAHHQRQAACSTRMSDTSPGQNVHFEDTFSTTDEREVWTRPSLPPQPARQRTGWFTGGKPSLGGR